MTLPTFLDSTAGVRLLAAAIFAPVIAGLLSDLLCRLTPRASAAARHLVWLLAFVAMAVCLPITLLNRRVTLPILPTPPALPASPSMPPVLSAAAVESEKPRSDLETTASPALPTQSVGPMMPAPQSTTSPRRQIRWELLIPGLWALGFLWQSFISLAGTLRLQGIIKRSRFCEDSRLLALWAELCPPDASRPVSGLLFSSEVKVPFVAFWRCPFVILPEAACEWPSPMLRTAFVHELAHIERNDLWWSAFARWVVTLYWFNPMAWYGLRRLQAEAEMAADDRVVSAGSSPADYAENLVLLVRTHRQGASSLFLAIGIARPRGIEARVARILDPRSRRLAPKPFVRLAALSGAVLITTGALMIRLVAAPPPAPADSTTTVTTNKPQGIQVNPALYSACESGDLAKVRDLLDHGADPSSQSPEGYSVLQIAAQKDHLAVARLLIERGADVNYKNDSNEGHFTALQMALVPGFKLDLQMVNLLLDHGADLKARDGIMGYSALCFAAMSENAEAFNLLLRKGANLDAKAEGGVTPLMIAAGASNVEVAKRIVALRPESVHERNVNGDTPLSIAQAVKAEFAKGTPGVDDASVKIMAQRADEMVQLLTKAGAAPPKAASGEPASGAATEAGKASAGAGSPEVQKRFAGIWTGTFFRSGSGNTDNITIVINATATSATASNFFPSPQTGSTSITGSTISWKWMLASWKMTVSQDGQTAQIDCDSPFEACRGTLVKKFDH